MGTENNDDNGNGHEGTQVKCRKICQETQIKWGKKAAVPTYKIYKKGEFG